MIRKEQVRIGMRIVGDDPESPESYPYKGTVTALCETGRNETFTLSSNWTGNP